MPPPAEELIPRLFLGPALRAQPDRRLVELVRNGYETAFYRIVRNTALNDLRDRPPSPQVLEEAIVDGRSAADEVERREEVAELLTRLRALPEPQRAAIVMRELEGLGHEEIAAALGLSGGAARQAIYRARRALRDGLGLLLPLPLLKALLAAGTAEAATGAAAGAGIAVKATAATVLVAGTIGTGVALNERQADDGSRSSRPAPAAAADDTPSGLLPLDSGSSDGESSGPGSGGSSGPGSGEENRDDDRSGPGDGEEDRSGTSGSGSSGSGSGSSSGEPESDSSGSGESGGDSGESDSSGSGSSGSGSDSSGSEEKSEDD